MPRITHHFLTQELAHREQHLPLLVHQFGDPRVLPVEALAAGGHGVADVNPALRVFLHADLAEVVGLLVVDRVLVAGGPRRPDRDDAIVERVLDVSRRGARDVTAELIELIFPA
jgi:hypothetical protein